MGNINNNNKCANCPAKTQKTVQEIPLISAECEATRQHNTIRLLIIGWIITVLLLFGSNLAWAIYESQYETVEENYDIEITQDTENGINTCVLNGGSCGDKAEDTH